MASISLACAVILVVLNRALLSPTEAINDQGFGWIAYLMGFSLFFMAAPLVATPLKNIMEEARLKSIPDLLAYRYQSPQMGQLATLLLCITGLGIMSVEFTMLSHAHVQAGVSSGHSFALTALSFLIGFFAFGISYKALWSKVAILYTGALIGAFGTLVLFTAAIWGLYQHHGGFSELSLWFKAYPEYLTKHQFSMDHSQWLGLLLVSCALLIAMPGLSVLFMQARLPTKGKATVSWVAPFMLLLMAFSSFLIYWSSSVFESLRWPLLIMAHIGIAYSFWLLLSALTPMFVNHLILPFFNISHEIRLYQKLVFIQAGAGIFLTLCLFSLLLLNLLPSPNEASIIAFASMVLLIMPAIVAGMLLPNMHRRAAFVGIWLNTPFLVIFLWECQGVSAFNLLPFKWLIWGVLANICGLFIGLYFNRTIKIDWAVQQLFFASVTRPRAFKMPIGYRPNKITETLSPLLGKQQASELVQQAMSELNLLPHEGRPFELYQLKLRVQAHLSNVVGPVVAQDFLAYLLPSNDLESASNLPADLTAMESRLEAYRNQLTGMGHAFDQLRQHHRQTLEDIPMPVTSLDQEGRIILWNSAMVRLTHINADQVLGYSVHTLPSPWKEAIGPFWKQQDPIWQKIKLVIHHQTRWVNLHQSSIQSASQASSDSEAFSGRVIVIEDLTEMLSLENQLTHTERLASIGRLAAGVAHEIGNPITGIEYIARELEEIERKTSTKKLARQIIDQTERVTGIVQSLVSFAHAGEDKDIISQSHAPVNLKGCIAEAILLLSLANKEKNIAFINVVDTDHYIWGDSQKLQQVLVNLLANSVDASDPFSHIYIEASLIHDKISIKITDEGSGISDDIREKIFDPFFTTKPAGEGTGLGLSLVYNIVAQHSGTIDIESPVNPVTLKGSCFILTFPLHQDKDNAYGTTAGH